MASAVVELQDVSRSFRQGDATVRALDAVNLSIPEGGMVVTIFGPSGSGKTTLLNLVGALDQPSSGRVIVEGADLAGLGERGLTGYRRRTVGFVFQTFNLIPNLSALENVAVPMEFAGVPRRQRRERATELLEAVAMGHRAAAPARKLSGGEQQRVGVARALANDPRIILADEPTGNLDAATGEQVVDLLARLAREQGRTVIIATHDATISAAADLRIGLRDGAVQTVER